MTTLGDWVEFTDPGTGKKYYHNPKTNVTTWTRPQITPNGTVSQPTAVQVPNVQRPPSVGIQTNSEPLGAPSKVEVPKLTVENTQAGMNSSVPQQQQSRPNDAVNSLKVLRNSLTQRPPDPEDDWQEFIDQKTGKPYYYNPRTKKTTWKKPTSISNQTNTPQSSSLEPTSVLVNRMQDEGHRSISLMTNSGQRIEFPIMGNGTSSLKYVKKQKVLFTGSKTLENYAKSHFKPRKKGIFSKTKPENLIKWQKKKMKLPLHDFKEEKYTQKGQEAFELIQYYMGDRKPKHPKESSEYAKELLQVMLNSVPVRNEIIVQICKQCNNNPRENSLLRGIQLLGLVCSSFPPTQSPELQEVLFHFLHQIQTAYKGKIIEDFARCAQQKLERALISGPRKTLPSTEVFKQVTDPKPPCPVFGVTIAEYMEWQQSTMPGVKEPKILEILANAVINSKGLSTEGIFRLPGNTKEIERLKDQFSAGKLVVDSKDPHVCASLFKLWLRELAEPIIPDELYQSCIDNSQDRDACIKIAMQLPEYHRIVLLYVIQFLGRFMKDEVFKKTKMSAENLAVVFSPNILRNRNTDPRVIMRNSPLEHSFVKNLILSAKLD